jgi:hypothetical protein
MANDPCPGCACREIRLRWQTFGDGRRHIRVECQACGRFLRYAEQTAENVTLADAGPPEPPGQQTFAFEEQA